MFALYLLIDLALGNHQLKNTIGWRIFWRAVYIWWGKEDTTVPLKYIEYFKKEYSVQKIHLLDDVGHMFYLPYWAEIINEIA